MSYTPKFKANKKNGKLAIERPRMFEAWLKTFDEDQEVSVIVKKWTRDRTLKQNDWYNGAVLSAITDRTGQPRDSVHEFCRRAFLREVKVDEEWEIIIDDFTGESLNMMDRVPSTTQLSTVEFTKYIEHIRLWAMEYDGIIIPDPE